MEPAEGAQHGYVTVRRKNAKNSKFRNVPLTARAVETLRTRRNPAKHEIVFCRHNRQPLYQTWLNQHHATLRALPSDFVLHHSGTRWERDWAETGADAFTIMKLMGHSTVTISQRYVHPSPRMENWSTARIREVGTNIGTQTAVHDRLDQQVV